MTQDAVVDQPVSAARLAVACERGDCRIALLTGGSDRPYAIGLARALAASGVGLDFIGSDQLDGPDLRVEPWLKVLNLRGDMREDVNLAEKVVRIVTYYARLVRYAAMARPKLFHILWNNKFEAIDRTVLMLYYKALGKKVVLTAHNVNARRRDGRDSMVNRLTLKVQYRLADHIFVHSQRLKEEMLREFGVRERNATVIPFGINDVVPRTELTSEEAKGRLGIGSGKRVVLFFGRIGPYKGVECLVAAFRRLAARDPDCHLVIAGQVERGSEAYLAGIRRLIREDLSKERVIERIEFVPDEETEVYFKAADLLVLPYTQISQSGVLVLGYSFGLPAVASDVGSFNEEVLEGRTGFLFKSGDAVDLASTIERYFRSELFESLRERRPAIVDHARKRYSWEMVSEITRRVYEQCVHA